MKTSWQCATLLPLFLFSCVIPKRQLKDNNPVYQRILVHSNVSLPCPKFTAVEMKFKLYKGPVTVATTTYTNITHVSASESLGPTTKHYVENDNTTRFVLYNVSADATALYTCLAEKFYPPPAEPIPEEPQSVVIVEEPVCVQNSQRMDPPANHIPLWAGFGALSVYSLLITFIALLLRFRLKREDMSSHDYMNMKPRTRRRKQGIHHPTHLSWYNDTSNGKAVSTKLPSKRTPV